MRKDSTAIFVPSAIVIDSPGMHVSSVIEGRYSASAPKTTVSRMARCVINVPYRPQSRLEYTVVSPAVCALQRRSSERYARRSSAPAGVRDAAFGIDMARATMRLSFTSETMRISEHSVRFRHSSTSRTMKYQLSNTLSSRRARIAGCSRP